MQSTAPHTKPIATAKGEQQPLQPWRTPTLTVLDIEQTQSSGSASVFETGTCKLGS